MQFLSVFLLPILLVHLSQFTPEFNNATDPSVLIGTWQLDLTPQNTTDQNFAMMHITSVDKSRFEGYFYRKGVKIKHGNLNFQRGIIYGALESGDGTGKYNTSFYLKDGQLFGSTHAIERDFLSTWVAIKQ